MRRSENKQMINGCAKKVRCYSIVLLFVSLTAFLAFNDEAIFSEIIEKYSQYLQYRFHKGELTEEEYNKAFYLDDEYRSSNANIILIWTLMFGAIQPIGTNKDGCILTYDRSAIDIAKAVVFHFAEIHDDPSWLPTKERKETQRWVWWCMEPPWNSRYVFRKKLSPLKNVFNWTMTYRTDSDVYFPYYGEWNRVNKTTAELIAEKTERSLGVWVVSNCRPSRRGSIINELQKYISIDVFGKCNHNRLCSGGCAIETINRYKFYFSFENSRCKDYITEKFTMNGLAGGAVPVVMGPTREDYEKIAPVHSFIHVDDFPSIPKLAEYLQQLDKDDIRYGEYLKWKSVPDSPNIKTDESLFNRPSQFKALCEKIKQDPNGNNKEIVSDLSTWWFGDDYNSDDSKISVCHSEDGPSGEALHHKIATGYFFAIFILFILTMKYCGGNSKTKHKTKS